MPSKKNSQKTYEMLDRPYGPFLERESESIIPGGGDQFITAGVSGEGQDAVAGISPTGGGTASTTPVKSAQSMSDLWIDNILRSTNWQPQKKGFYINGESGYAEFSNIFITGNITAVTGTIGGWQIASNQLSSGSIFLKSTAEQILVGAATDPSTGVGIFIGKDGSDYELRAGDPAGAYMHWNGSTLVLAGGVVTDLGTGSDLAMQGWQFNSTFSASDFNTVAWTAGTLTFQNGVSYSISSGNTGNVSSPTYIYFDSAASSTVLQTSTTPGDAVGANKVLLAVCEDNPDSAKDATFQVFGGSGGSSNIITADQIAANTITANEILANTITATELSTTILYAGTITLDTLGNIKGGQTGFDTGSGFFLGYSTADYKFSIGDSDNNKKMTWDGENLRANNLDIITTKIAGEDITAKDAVYVGTNNNEKTTEYATNTTGGITVTTTDWAAQKITISATGRILKTIGVRLNSSIKPLSKNWTVRLRSVIDGADLTTRTFTVSIPSGSSSTLHEIDFSYAVTPGNDYYVIFNESFDESNTYSVSVHDQINVNEHAFDVSEAGGTVSVEPSTTTFQSFVVDYVDADEDLDGASSATAFVQSATPNVPAQADLAQESSDSGATWADASPDKILRVLFTEEYGNAGEVLRATSVDADNKMTAFFGFALESVSQGAEVDVQIAGIYQRYGTLAPGSNYYIGEDYGDIDTTSDTGVLVGTAIPSRTFSTATDMNASEPCEGTRWCAQSFTVPTNVSSINYVQLYIAGYESNSLQLTLTDDLNTIPASIAAVSVASNAGYADEIRAFSVDLSGLGYSVTPGNTYYLVVRMPTTTGSLPGALMGNSVSQYAGGSAFVSNNSGSTWSAAPTVADFKMNFYDESDLFISKQII